MMIHLDCLTLSIFISRLHRKISPVSCNRPSSLRWMGEFTTALLTKLPAMDPPLLASSMLAFSSLKYEPERSLIKAYYMQVCDRILGRHWKGDVGLEEEDLIGLNLSPHSGLLQAASV